MGSISQGSLNPGFYERKHRVRPHPPEQRSQWKISPCMAEKIRVRQPDHPCAAARPLLSDSNGVQSRGGRRGPTAGGRTHNEGAGAPGPPHIGGHDYISQHPRLPPDWAQEAGGTRGPAIPSRPQAPAAARPPSSPPRRRPHRALAPLQPRQTWSRRPAEVQRAIPGQRGAAAARMAADGTHHHPGGAPGRGSPTSHKPHPTMHRARREASPGREGKRALLGDRFRPRSMVRADRAAPARCPSSPNNHKEAGSLFARGRKQAGLAGGALFGRAAEGIPKSHHPGADTELTATERSAGGRAGPRARRSGD